MSRCFPVYYFLVSFGEFDRLQNLTPYLSGLLAYVRRGIVPFHTPGHKQGRALPSVLAECQEHWAALDLSDVVECPSLDHAEPLVLQAAEKLAAELYGVHSTLFLSNGTSQGIIGMLLAAGFGRRVLLSRNCHISAVRGLILSGATPQWLPVIYDESWGLVVGVDLEVLRNLTPDFEAALIVHPTYHGFVNDFTLLRDFCRAGEVKLLVDEAHGPHFIAHRHLPKSAVTWPEATAVAQSPHKILGAFTGASWLHLVQAWEGLEECVRLVQSTSPSPLLFASLDAARWQLAQEGPSLFGQTLQLAAELREEISRIPGLWCPTPEQLKAKGIVDFDPLKLLIFVDQLGISGIQAKRFLRERGIEAELADPHSVLFILTPGDDEKTAKTLLRGLACLSRELRGRGAAVPVLHWPSLPPQRLIPREAFFAPGEELDIRSARGRIAATVLAVYPPGIPVLVPGEEITEEIIAYVEQALALEVSFNHDPLRIRVVK